MAEIAVKRPTPELHPAQGETQPSNPASTDPCSSKSQEEPEGKQTNRILGVVPNFGAVSANTQLPPLSAKGKFLLATEDTFDYSSFVWTGILAAQEYGLNNFPEFGTGMAAYGRYYWHTFVDGVSGTYFTEAMRRAADGDQLGRPDRVRRSEQPGQRVLAGYPPARPASEISSGPQRRP
jgi:hypothetical protein